jgi:hypothetical protein
MTGANLVTACDIVHHTKVVSTPYRGDRLRLAETFVSAFKDTCHEFPVDFSTVWEAFGFPSFEDVLNRLADISRRDVNYHVDSVSGVIALTFSSFQVLATCACIMPNGATPNLGEHESLMTINGRWNDPVAYVRQSLGCLLEIDKIMPVSHARSAEKIVHCALKRYRIESFRSRELFLDLPLEETHATLSWAAELMGSHTLSSSSRRMLSSDWTTGFK